MSGVKWGYLGNFELNSIKNFLGLKSYGVIWDTLSQALIFIVVITIIVCWCLENECYKNLVYFSLF